MRGLQAEGQVATDVFERLDLQVLDRQLDQGYAAAFALLSTEVAKSAVTLELVSDQDQVSLASVDTAPPEDARETERYAHSLRAVRMAGRYAVLNCLDSPEGSVAVEQLRADFDTGIGEMLNTDAEFRDRLDINPYHLYDIMDGKVIMKDGTPITQMIERGVERSRQAAKEDVRMLTQACRDEADLCNSQLVDTLEDGELWLAVSMEPKAAIARDGEEFWADKLGYRKGLAFAQWYYRSGDTMTAGSYSIDHSDTEAMRQLLTAYGVDAPRGLADEEWLKYGLRTRLADVTQAEQLVRGFRDNYYKHQKVSQSKFSVTDFLNGPQKPLMDSLFNDVYLSMSASAYSGQKTEIIHAYASQLLQNSAHIAPAMRQKLAGICARSEFDDADARTMEFLIRYGVVEELRKQLPGLLQTKPAGYDLRLAPMPQIVYSSENTAAIVARLAQNVAAGAAAGRSYGGCAAGLTLSGGKNGDDFNPQDAFGGLMDANKLQEDEEGGTWTWKPGVCRVDRCPTRPGTTEVGPCEVCRCCQRIFDQGKDPSQLYAPSAPEPAVSSLALSQKEDVKTMFALAA